jgi:hypothetical protein
METMQSTVGIFLLQKGIKLADSRRSAKRFGSVGNS